MRDQEKAWYVSFPTTDLLRHTCMYTKTWEWKREGRIDESNTKTVKQHTMRGKYSAGGVGRTTTMDGESKVGSQPASSQAERSSLRMEGIF